MIKELFFKFGYALRMHRLFRPGRSVKIVVVCLHRINTKGDRLFAPLTPAVFARLIQLLRREYEIVGFGDINEMKLQVPRKKPLMVLSFDDGYKDFIDFALPVIKKEKITVNHNIVVNSAETGQLIWTQRLNNILGWMETTGQSLQIGYEDITLDRNVQGAITAVKKELVQLLFPRNYPFIDGFITAIEKKYSFEQPAGEMMSWDDIIACDKEGVDIGSHTVYHSSLAEYTDEAFITNEISGSKKMIEEKLGKPVDSFAFPNGLAHPKAYAMAINAGYKNLLLVDGVKYDYAIVNGPVIHSYKRILIGHPTVYENIFNISGFHKALKGA